MGNDNNQPSHVRLIPSNNGDMSKGWTVLGNFRVRLVEESNGTSHLVIATPNGNLVIHPVTENFVYLEVEQ